MTKEEAINTLKALKATLKIYPKRKKQKESVAQLTEAINMAISALQAELKFVSIETYRDLYEKYIELKHKSAEDIKKKQIEVGAVADGIVGYETIKKSAERYKTESSDLISRRWLLDLYGDYIGDNGKPKYHVPLEVVRQNIIDAPSADAVSREEYEDIIKDYRKQYENMNNEIADLEAKLSADRPSGQVDAVYLYECAVADLENYAITIGEFQRRIEPLQHLYYDRSRF